MTSSPLEPGVLLVGAVGALGLAAGALVSLVARSLPTTGRLLAVPACSSCGAAIDWWAISAVVRRLAPGGACRACGSGADLADVVVELATVAAFLAFAMRGLGGAALAAHLLFAALLVAISVIDLRHREVYLSLGVGGLAAGLLLAPLTASGGLASAIHGATVGAALFATLYWAGRVAYRGREPLGSGDIVIAGLLGALAGFPGVIVALTLGVLIGGAGAGLLLVLGRGRRTYMPYGPGLCLGGLVALLVR